MDEHERAKLVPTKDESFLKVKIPSKGRHFVSGLASSYDESYYPNELSGIVSAEELKDIIRRLNDQILSFWPCATIMAIGYVLIPCTFGLSLLCPQMCVGEAELAVQKFLDNQTYKAKFYDRKISFKLVKSLCSKSYVEISVPTHLFENVMVDTERGGGDQFGVGGIISQQPGDVGVNKTQKKIY